MNSARRNLEQPTKQPIFMSTQRELEVIERLGAVFFGRESEWTADREDGSIGSKLLKVKN